MAKVKVSTLAGAGLDWAVHVALARPISFSWLPGDRYYFSPSTQWAHGGPIIEREWLDLTPWPNESDEEVLWQCAQHDNIDCLAFGPTVLIAAMRCFVTSNLGDTVDVPEELLNG